MVSSCEDRRDNLETAGLEAASGHGLECLEALVGSCWKGFA